MIESLNREWYWHYIIFAKTSKKTHRVFKSNISFCMIKKEKHAVLVKNLNAIYNAFQRKKLCFSKEVSILFDTYNYMS